MYGRVVSNPIISWSKDQFAHLRFTCIFNSDLNKTSRAAKSSDGDALWGMDVNTSGHGEQKMAVYVNLKW